MEDGQEELVVQVHDIHGGASPVEVTDLARGPSLMDEAMGHESFDDNDDDDDDAAPVQRVLASSTGSVAATSEAGPAIVAATTDPGPASQRVKLRGYDYQFGYSNSGGGFRSCAIGSGILCQLLLHGRSSSAAKTQQAEQDSKDGVRRVQLPQDTFPKFLSSVSGGGYLLCSFINWLRFKESDKQGDESDLNPQKWYPEYLRQMQHNASYYVPAYDGVGEDGKMEYCFLWRCALYLGSLILHLLFWGMLLSTFFCVQLSMAYPFALLIDSWVGDFLRTQDSVYWLGPATMLALFLWTLMAAEFFKRTSVQLYNETQQYLSAQGKNVDFLSFFRNKLKSALQSALGVVFGFIFFTVGAVLLFFGLSCLAQDPTHFSCVPRLGIQGWLIGWGLLLISLPWFGLVAISEPDSTYKYQGQLGSRHYFPKKVLFTEDKVDKQTRLQRYLSNILTNFVFQDLEVEIASSNSSAQGTKVEDGKLVAKWVPLKMLADVLTFVARTTGLVLVCSIFTEVFYLSNTYSDVAKVSPWISNLIIALIVVGILSQAGSGMQSLGLIVGALMYTNFIYWKVYQTSTVLTPEYNEQNWRAFTLASCVLLLLLPVTVYIKSGLVHQYYRYRLTRGFFYHPGGYNIFTHLYFLWNDQDKDIHQLRYMTQREKDKQGDRPAALTIGTFQPKVEEFKERTLPIMNVCTTLNGWLQTDEQGRAIIRNGRTNVRAQDKTDQLAMSSEGVLLRFEEGLGYPMKVPSVEGRPLVQPNITLSTAMTMAAAAMSINMGEMDQIPLTKAGRDLMVMLGLNMGKNLDTVNRDSRVPSLRMTPRLQILLAMLVNGVTFIWPLLVLYANAPETIGLFIFFFFIGVPIVFLVVAQFIRPGHKAFFLIASLEFLPAVLFAVTYGNLERWAPTPGKKLFVSDGAFSENLGVLGLASRRMKYILACAGSTGGCMDEFPKLAYQLREKLGIKVEVLPSDRKFRSDFYEQHKSRHVKDSNPYKLGAEGQEPVCVKMDNPYKYLSRFESDFYYNNDNWGGGAMDSFTLGDVPHRVDPVMVDICQFYRDRYHRVMVLKLTYPKLTGAVGKQYDRFSTSQQEDVGEQVGYLYLVQPRPSDFDDPHSAASRARRESCSGHVRPGHVDNADVGGLCLAGCSGGGLARLCCLQKGTFPDHPTWNQYLSSEHFSAYHLEGLAMAKEALERDLLDDGTKCYGAFLRATDDNKGPNPNPLREQEYGGDMNDEKVDPMNKQLGLLRTVLLYSKLHAAPDSLDTRLAQLTHTLGKSGGLGWEAAPEGKEKEQAHHGHALYFDKVVTDKAWECHGLDCPRKRARDKLCIQGDMEAPSESLGGVPVFKCHSAPLDASRAADDGKGRDEQGRNQQSSFCSRVLCDLCVLQAVANTKETVEVGSHPHALSVGPAPAGVTCAVCSQSLDGAPDSLCCMSCRGYALHKSCKKDDDTWDESLKNTMDQLRFTTRFSQERTERGQKEQENKTLKVSKVTVWTDQANASAMERDETRDDTVVDRIDFEFSDGSRSSYGTTVSKFAKEEQAFVLEDNEMLCEVKTWMKRNSRAICKIGFVAMNTTTKEITKEKEYGKAGLDSELSRDRVLEEVVEGSSKSEKERLKPIGGMRVAISREGWVASVKEVYSVENRSSSQQLFLAHECLLAVSEAERSFADVEVINMGAQAKDYFRQEGWASRDKPKRHAEGRELFSDYWRELKSNGLFGSFGKVSLAATMLLWICGIVEYVIDYGEFNVNLDVKMVLMALAILGIILFTLVRSNWEGQGWGMRWQGLMMLAFVFFRMLVLIYAYCDYNDLVFPQYPNSLLLRAGCCVLAMRAGTDIISAFGFTLNYYEKEVMPRYFFRCEMRDTRMRNRRPEMPADETAANSEGKKEEGNALLEKGTK
eukprot:g17926.t1